MILALGLTPCFGQNPDDDEIERPPVPKLDQLDVDANGDGVPDGWYNLRDAKWVEGGVGGPKSRCFRFECTRPGRPARASRAFGVDGRKVEAIVVGLWIRADNLGPGERMGDEPGVLIDFLGHELRAVRRGIMGPWTKRVGKDWTRVVKRFAIHPETRDAILSLGLLGATGVLEVDDLTIETIPVGGTVEPNLVANGDFELGDPAPNGWIAENGAGRGFPGHESPAAGLLDRGGSRLLAPLGTSVEGLNSLQFTVAYRAKDLRGADAVRAGVFFLDEDGHPLPGPSSARLLFRWTGSNAWAVDHASAPVPPGAKRAVVQFEKTHAAGSVLIDDLVAVPNPPLDPAKWRPYHVEDLKDDWTPLAASKEVAAGSALDASPLLDAPAGRRGVVTVKDGRLHFADGGRARFFGVQLLAPTAFLEPARADALADRLARSGVNLVRLGDLDAAYGPARSLYDDVREDTRELDSVAIGRLDHLVAALKKRGIYVAIELQSVRRFRPEDDVPSVGSLPLGGGPAALFDPKLRAAFLKGAKDLLGHVNPETGLALKDDPALAWVTLLGEVSLFDQIDDPDVLSSELATALKSRGQGRSGWRIVEATALKEMAESLRASGLKAPVAGVSHWRREPEFGQAQQGAGLDLVDDRLFWLSSPFADPGRRSLAWSRDGGLITLANKKRKTDRPYVVGQWCDQTFGAWALPFEGADLMVAAASATAEDWDALVRRGIFPRPEVWGSSATGTGGGDDIFGVPESIPGIPPVYSLLPHAASVVLRDHPARRPTRGRAEDVPGWDARKGRLAIVSPHTVALAGWPGVEPAQGEALSIRIDNAYAVVAASSLDEQPIASAKRLLVTAVARVEPTGYAWVDESRRDVADPGRPPLLREPVIAAVEWRRAGSIKAYALDPEGRRAGPVELIKVADGVRLPIDKRASGMHWELVVE